MSFNAPIAPRPAGTVHAMLLLPDSLHQLSQRHAGRPVEINEMTLDGSSYILRY